MGVQNMSCRGRAVGQRDGRGQVSPVSERVGACRDTILAA